MDRDELVKSLEILGERVDGHYILLEWSHCGIRTYGLLFKSYDSRPYFSDSDEVLDGTTQLKDILRAAKGDAERRLFKRPRLPELSPDFKFVTTYKQSEDVRAMEKIHE